MDLEPVPPLSSPTPAREPLLAVVPAEVGRVARAWEGQHLDLASAARLVAGAPTSGFGPAVVAAADDLTARWEHHLAGLARTAGSTGVTLRMVTSSLVTTDEAAASSAARLTSRLGSGLADAA